MLVMWTDWVCSPTFLWSWMGLAAAVALMLTRISAPYGRHGRPGWGPTLPARWAWCVMEVVTLLGFGMCWWFGGEPTAAGVLFLVLYGGHYLYRSFIYPLLTPPGASPVPATVAGMAVVFNVINSTILGGWLYLAGPPLESIGVRTVLGVLLFVFGFVTHVRSDAILRSLRRDQGAGYHIPRGFLYRWVSCPNYFGEIVQWCGFALAIDALAGWTFVVWTIANLLPRALRHHRWYQERFSDYPAHRRAIIPGLL
jgi:3-oxo-5-alpha-steroid 4-dehydrogenase 1